MSARHQSECSELLLRMEVVGKKEGSGERAARETSVSHPSSSFAGVCSSRSVSHEAPRSYVEQHAFLHVLKLCCLSTLPPLLRSLSASSSFMRVAWKEWCEV